MVAASAAEPRFEVGAEALGSRMMAPVVAGVEAPGSHKLVAAVVPVVDTSAAADWVSAAQDSRMKEPAVVVGTPIVEAVRKLESVLDIGLEYQNRSRTMLSRLLRSIR